MSTPNCSPARRGAALLGSLLLVGLLAVPGAAQETGSSDSQTVLAQAEGESEDGEEGEKSKQSTGNQQQGGSSLKRGDRMEFDTRLIRGERASGAVFLFQRTPRKLPSMVERRRTYLENSVRTILGRDWAKTFSEQRRETRGGATSDDESEEEGKEPEGDIIERMASDDEE